MRVIGVVIPDVHEQIIKLKFWLTVLEEKYGKDFWIVFQGDFFDTFAGLTWETHETCRWLGDNLLNERYRFVWGNHDMPYRFPKNEDYPRPGFDMKKLAISKNHLGEDHWKKFKLHHWIGEKPSNNRYLISHAGLHPAFLHPVHGFDDDYLDFLAEEAMDGMRINKITPYLTIGPGRGGMFAMQRVGGIIWLDWNTEFAPIDGLNQMVGHSPDKMLRSKHKDNSKNFCLDTHLNHVALIMEDGSVTFEEISSDFKKPASQFKKSRSKS